MDKKVNNQVISEKNMNSKYISNNRNVIKEYFSRRFFLSSNRNKKMNFELNKFNQANSSSSRSLTKKEKNSNFLSESSYTKKEIKKDINNIKQKKNKLTLEKIIVDNIENIYQYLSKLPNKLLKQRIFLFIICFYVSSIHWTYLFLTKRKLERDYCFTKLNQFEVCVPEQYCSMNVINKINYHFYNDYILVHSNSLNKLQALVQEMNTVNEYYKEFIINYNYLLSKNRLLHSENMKTITDDKFNFVVILFKKEKWNIFLYFNSYCQKDMYFFYILAMITSGGFLGSYIFGILADAYGRKKLIILTLFLVTLSFVFIFIICFLIEKKNNYFFDEFNRNYISSKNNTNYDILSKYFYHSSINILFRSSITLFLISIFILNFSLRPLSKLVLSLLIENSSSDLKVLQNYRKYTFISKALPPFIISQIMILLNDFLYLLLFFCISFFILFISSFFILNESLRHLYEYCEWAELTNEIFHLYSLSDNVPINFKNKNEFEAFQFEENEKMLKNIIYLKEHSKNEIAKKNNTIYRILKKRIESINRDIRRNCEFIIKKDDVKANPYIIYSCLKSNFQFQKSRHLFFIILFIIYFQEYLVERELAEEPFFGLSDLFIEPGNNIIINSNYLLLGIVIFASNYIYYIFYRINCLKLSLFISLIMITFLFMLYHLIFDESYEFPVYLNQYNFKTFQIPHIRENKYKSHILLYLIVFFLNGITFYMNIIFFKLSKTLYRCTFFGINSILFLAGMGFGDLLIFEVKHYFFLVGSLNFVGIVVVMFLGEFKNIPFIINDLKKFVVKCKKVE